MSRFPLSIAPSGRYLLDAAGKPFRVQGAQVWLSPSSFSTSDFQSMVDVLKSKGFTAVTIMFLNHNYEEHTLKTPGTGPRSNSGIWPVTLNTAGAAYVGTGIASPPNGTTPLATQWADLSTPNGPYFAIIDTCLTVLDAADMLAFSFPAYMGFQGKIEGWNFDKLNSGSAKCYTYGLFIGNRYKNFGNILWMLGGDFDPSTWTGAAVTCEEQMAQGIRDGGATQLMGGHFPYHNGLSTDISNTSATLAAKIQVNTIYAFQDTNQAMYQSGAAGWAFSPATPVLLFDPGDLYENQQSQSVTDVRAHAWWGAIATTVGQCFGNNPVWFSGDTTFASINNSSGLLSTGHTQQTYLGRFFDAIAWWLLVPASQAGMSILVTAGNGSNGSTSWIQASADPVGRLLVAYVPPAWALGTFTVDTSFMQRQIRARWFDPTDSTYQTISGSPFNFASTHVFTPPGANSTGQTDWTLVLDPAPETLFFADVA